MLSNHKFITLAVNSRIVPFYNRISKQDFRGKEQKQAGRALRYSEIFWSGPWESKHWHIILSATFVSYAPHPFSSDKEDSSMGEWPHGRATSLSTHPRQNGLFSTELSSEVLLFWTKFKFNSDAEFMLVACVVIPLKAPTGLSSLWKSYCVNPARRPQPDCTSMVGIWKTWSIHQPGFERIPCLRKSECSSSSKDKTHRNFYP